MINVLYREPKSIILTCIVNNYNRANYIEECLESILLQETKYKFEVVVIDDCSTDNSKQVVENIKNKYSAINLHFFSTKKNTGVGKKAVKKLNSQIKRFLKSKYICRIDSDDYFIDNKKFEKQISLLESNPDCVGVCHHFKILDANDNSEKVANQAITGILSAKQLIACLVSNTATYNHTSTYLYRNVFQAALPTQFNMPWIKGDVLYNWCMIKRGKVCFTDDIMSVYRIHKGGVWSSLSKRKQKFLNDLLVFKIFFVLSIKHKIYFLFLKIKKFIKEKHG
tara:strand:+ start:3553 stop:4395 length:843 start_codon:yes stop_codon:yes gene_type:complete